MSGNHSSPSRRREGENRQSAPRGGRSGGKLTLALGWVFLAAVIVLAAVTLMRLLPSRDEGDDTSQTGVAPGPAGSAFTSQGVQSLTTQEGQGGRSVKIQGVDCVYTPPEEITFGRLTTVDLSGIGQSLCDNVRAAGWGDTVWSLTENGSLLLRAAQMRALTGAEFESQAAFLQTRQPENLARTFLDNSGLIALLRGYGLYLSTDVENTNGEIVFTGTGSAPQSACSARFTFMYNGLFDQAVIRAVYLADAVTTREVTPLNDALEHAVTWSAGSGGDVRVTAVELRQVKGIPFYVFTCSDGTAAYALAVDEDILAQVPGAAQIYAGLMADGIENNVNPSGGE